MASEKKKKKSDTYGHISELQEKDLDRVLKEILEEHGF